MALKSTYVQSIRNSDFVSLVASVLLTLIIAYVFNIILDYLESISSRASTLARLTDDLTTKEDDEKEIKITYGNKFKSATSIDCLTQGIPCRDSVECESKCQLTSTPFVCDNNHLVCIPYTSINDEPIEVPETKCNTKHGILALLQGNLAESKVKWNCMSLYREYYDDFDVKSPLTCGGKGSTLSVNILRQPPSWNDCVCGKDSTLMISIPYLDNGKSLGPGVFAFGQVPRCVEKRNTWLFSSSLMIPSGQSNGLFEN